MTDREETIMLAYCINTSSYTQNEFNLALDKRNLVSLGLCCFQNEVWATSVWRNFYRYNQQKEAALV